MTATIPPYKQRTPVGTVQVFIVISLIFSVLLFKLHLAYRERQAIASEFQSSRAFILSKIDSATARQDIETLTSINSKYAGSVSDSTFHSSIRQAFAQVSAREAALELAVSRHLDLLRHQEESRFRPNPRKPQVPSDGKPGDQPLSELPR